MRVADKTTFLPYKAVAHNRGGKRPHLWLTWFRGLCLAAGRHLPSSLGKWNNFTNSYKCIMNVWDNFSRNISKNVFANPRVLCLKVVVFMECTDKPKQKEIQFKQLYMQIGCVFECGFDCSFESFPETQRSLQPTKFLLEQEKTRYPCQSSSCSLHNCSE